MNRLVHRELLEVITSSPLVTRIQTSSALTWKQPNYTRKIARSMSASSASSSSRMPSWHAPQGETPTQEVLYPLKLYNSLTRSTVPFIPKENGRVYWYICGPTVYDSAHMGHARTYLTFDIVRRILRDYFGYDVLLVMNITDIDDKIIMRANERNIAFHEISRHFEQEFWQDMEKLGVTEPDAVTRISEYIPECIDFINKIIEAGYAYESNGSVYFDVEQYQASPDHTYGKLVPENVGDVEATEEGEGALSSNAGKKDKKNQCDFALWKASKEGEPSWESPWGSGRPGWHIECSVMASDSLKDFTGDGTMDIHSGGIDLRFPHHDNEIAQSEACLGCKQWVNYFLHAGHLHIEGQKMAKSLKNFVRINDALSRFTSSQIRLLFLGKKYNAPMEYSENAMSAAVDEEKKFREFFNNVKAFLRELSGKERQMKWGSYEKELMKHTMQAKRSVRSALLNDFDTPEAMRVLRELVGHVNRYMAEADKPVSNVVRNAAEYVTYMFQIFGLIDPIPSIGYSLGHNEGGVNREDVATPYLNVLTEFRGEVRAKASEGDSKGILKLCDEVRDSSLPEIGVRLEDGALGDAGRWKLEDPEVLRREREEKLRIQQEKEEQKRRQKELENQRQAELDARKQIPPEQYFRQMKDEEGNPLYSQFDEDGIPTHDASGTPLAKNTLKKLKKEYQKQSKLYNKE
eukprot:gb/GECG01003802.1/.p1 GENE.gb/GECG01003802.1/~~gb/GECG01003802.1/.p1  ORF type:complete len:689 (+),score=112.91 gb/GECG01003802.1/:1-2067(+)